MSRQKPMVILTLLTVMICLTTTLDFAAKASVNTTDGLISNVRFSDDQMFLASLKANASQFTIYNGFNLELLQTVQTVNNTVDPQAVAFAHDSSIFAFGDENGNVFLYGRNGAMFADTPYNSTTVTSTNGVTALAFSNNNQILAIANFAGVITFYDVPAPSKPSGIFSLRNGPMNKLRANPLDFGVKVNAMSFGPVNGNLFIGGGDNTAAKVGLYNTSNDFAELGTLAPADAVLGVSWFFDESFLLTASADGLARLWNGDFTVNQTLTPDAAVTVNALYEILSSSNGLYIVAAGNTNALSWSRPNVGTAFTAKTAIPSNLANIAFGRVTGDLILVTDSLTVLDANIGEFSLCAFTTFYNTATDVCDVCLDSCQSCYLTEDTCYACSAKSFLEGTTCQACMSGCNVCTDNSSCTACDGATNWILVDTVCECAPSFFQLDDACAACVVGCLSCNDATTCETCDAAGNFVKNAGNICECNPQFRLNVNLCVACGLGCDLCDDTGCTACDELEHFLPVAD